MTFLPAKTERMYQQIGDTIESLIAKIGFKTESDFIIRQLYKERLTFTDFYVSLFYLFQCFFYEPLFYWFVNHKDDDDDDDDDACNNTSVKSTLTPFQWIKNELGVRVTYYYRKVVPRNVTCGEHAKCMHVYF